MLTTVVYAGLFSAMLKPDRIEVPFFSSVARFKVKHWDSILKVGGDVHVAPTAEGLPSGYWIYFDVPGNKVVLGRDNGSVSDLAQFIRQFDVVPKRIRLETTFERKDIGLKMTGTLETDSGDSVSFGSPESKSFVSIKPRVNDDGTVTLFVELQKDGGSASAAVRLNSGQVFWTENGQFNMGPARHPMGSGGMSQKNWDKFGDYTVTIKPSIVN